MDCIARDDSQTYVFKYNRYSSHNQIINIVDPNTEVLDVGCGKGIISRCLSKKNCTVVGIDREEPDPSFTSYMNYIRQDLERPLTAITGKRFDYVLATDVLEHVRNRTQLLQEIATGLKSGGLLVASTGNIALFVYRFLLFSGRFNYCERGILDKDHVHLFTISTFKSLIEEAGFHIIDCYYTPIPLELVCGPKLGKSWFVERLTSTYQILARLWPGLFAYQIIIKAQLKSP